MSDPIFEIRDCHYDPDRMDAYRVWAAAAVPVRNPGFEGYLHMSVRFLQHA